MIDLDYLEQLIRLVDESGLDSLEVEDEGTMIRLAKSPDGGVVAGPAQLVAGPVAQAADAAVAAPEETEPDSHLVDVTSPMVGTFYRSPAPDAPSYVDVGSSVAPGATLCIIEAMKLMNEIESDIDGEIVEIHPRNAQPVEFGEPLFGIRS